MPTQVNVYHMHRDGPTDAPIEVILGCDTQSAFDFIAKTLRGQTPEVRYEHVAKVDVSELTNAEPWVLLDRAFERTNNINMSWTWNRDVVALTNRARSTSVGDVMVLNGEVYAVQGCGFGLIAGITEGEFKS